MEWAREKLGEDPEAELLSEAFDNLTRCVKRSFYKKGLELLMTLGRWLFERAVNDENGFRCNVYRSGCSRVDVFLPAMQKIRRRGVEPLYPQLLSTKIL